MLQTLIISILIVDMYEYIYILLIVKCIITVFTLVNIYIHSLAIL